MSTRRQPFASSGTPLYEAAPSGGYFANDPNAQDPPLMMPLPPLEALRGASQRSYSGVSEQSIPMYNQPPMDPDDSFYSYYYDPPPWPQHQQSGRPSPVISSDPRIDPFGNQPRDSDRTEKDDISSFPSQYNSSSRLAQTLHPHGARDTRFLSTKTLNYDGGRKPAGRTCTPTNPNKRKILFIGLPLALVVIAGAVIGGVMASQHHSSDASTSAADSTTTSNSSTIDSDTQTTWNINIQTGSGEDGSTVTTDLGVEFTYSNDFGGSWAQDPYNTYNVSGRAQSWSPSLLEEWIWGEHIVRGVNLGGWLVTEPFICPSLYEKYQDTTTVAVDEYTLSQAMGDDLATEMEEHYKTFITEEDFALIAGAGLNHVRIALGYWAIETIDGEPYLSKVSWTYFLKAIDWARKYGIRIFLDFHALPGSQNGWNHSGKSGVVNWLYGVMGIVNAERSLEILRSLTEYISQDGIKEVVTMIGLVNEVQSTVVGQENLSSFYYQAYELIRGVTGYGSGNGPMILLHEGFLGIATWDGFLSGADRLGLDQHPYLAFSTQITDNHTVQATSVCDWGGGTNDTSSNFGVVIGGEWSNAINDCGYWLNGAGSTALFETEGVGNCSQWDEWWNYSDATKASINAYALANMDALQNHFFWTWKIGNSTVKGYQTSPLWHYKLGLEQGWMPTDPRGAGGHCSSLGVGGDQFNGTYPSSAIGSFASGATPTIAPTQVSSYSVWPPTALGPSPSFSAAQISLFPTLTQTGTRNVLATPTHPSNVTLGGGWVSSADATGAWVRVAGCDYPDQYNATAVDVPTAVCTGSS